MYDVGKALLVDDKMDIGYTIYYNRKGHLYHGRRSPHHPSALHHWQLAIPMILGSQILALIAKAKEVYTAFQEVDGIFEEDEIDRENAIPVKYTVLDESVNPELIKKLPELPQIYY